MLKLIPILLDHFCRHDDYEFFCLCIFPVFNSVFIEPSGFIFGLRFSRHTPIARQGNDARKTRAGVVCFLSAFKRAKWNSRPLYGAASTKIKAKILPSSFFPSSNGVVHNLVAAARIVKGNGMALKIRKKVATGLLPVSAASTTSSLMRRRAASCSRVAASRSHWP